MCAHWLLLSPACPGCRSQEQDASVCVRTQTGAGELLKEALWADELSQLRACPEQFSKACVCLVTRIWHACDICTSECFPVNNIFYVCQSSLSLPCLCVFSAIRGLPSPRLSRCKSAPGEPLSRLCSLYFCFACNNQSVVVRPPAPTPNPQRLALHHEL